MDESDCSEKDQKVDHQTRDSLRISRISQGKRMLDACHPEADRSTVLWSAKYHSDTE